MKSRKEQINEYWHWDNSIRDFVTSKSFRWIEENGGLKTYPDAPPYDEKHPNPQMTHITFITKTIFTCNNCGVSNNIEQFTLYICSYCKTENDADNTFCDGCGFGARICDCGKAKKVSEPEGVCEYCKTMKSDTYSLEGMPFTR